MHELQMILTAKDLELLEIAIEAALDKCFPDDEEMIALLYRVREERRRCK